MFDSMNKAPCIQDHIRVALSTKHRGVSEHGVLSDQESDHGDVILLRLMKFLSLIHSYTYNGNLQDTLQCIPALKDFLEI